MREKNDVDVCPTGLFSFKLPSSAFASPLFTLPPRICFFFFFFTYEA